MRARIGFQLVLRQRKAFEESLSAFPPQRQRCVTKGQVMPFKPDSRSDEAHLPEGCLRQADTPPSPAHVFSGRGLRGGRNVAR
jgi:hypothetical protein